MIASLVLIASLPLAPPPAAHQYRRELGRSARAVWGTTAPIATFAGQIHQESAWNPHARSAFAAGLTQFTPATAEWIHKTYGAELGEGGALNPTWALRALVRYDKHLWDRIDSPLACDRMAMTLAAYNGGLGWIYRDARLAAGEGANPKLWWGHVESYSQRATWAFDENRDYPRKILFLHQARYEAWGPMTHGPCGEEFGSGADRGSLR